MAGRPVMGKPRSTIVRLAALPEEEERWRAAAQLEGISLSEWLRRLANEAARSKKKRGDK